MHIYLLKCEISNSSWNTPIKLAFETRIHKQDTILYLQLKLSHSMQELEGSVF